MWAGGGLWSASDIHGEERSGDWGQGYKNTLSSLVSGFRGNTSVGTSTNGYKSLELEWLGFRDGTRKVTGLKLSDFVGLHSALRSDIPATFSVSLIPSWAKFVRCADAGRMHFAGFIKFDTGHTKWRSLIDQWHWNSTLTLLGFAMGLPRSTVPCTKRCKINIFI